MYSIFSHRYRFLPLVHQSALNGAAMRIPAYPRSPGLTHVPPPSPQSSCQHQTLGSTMGSTLGGSWQGTMGYSRGFYAPQATAAIDTTGDGRANVLVSGADRNYDGIPDSLQGMRCYLYALSCDLTVSLLLLFSRCSYPSISRCSYPVCLLHYACHQRHHHLPHADLSLTCRCAHLPTSADNAHCISRQTDPNVTQHQPAAAESSVSGCTWCSTQVCQPTWWRCVLTWLPALGGGVCSHGFLQSDTPSDTG